jgi:hypothetical protein
MGKTGLSGQLGIGAQSVFTTRVAPTRFYEFLSEGIKLDSQRASSQGLRANKRVTRHWRENRKGVAGPISIEHPIVGSGLLWKYILGAVATTTPSGATNARDHAATLGALDGDFFTAQVGRASVAGVVHPFDYVGCKIASASLSQSVDGFLQLEMQVDGWDEQTNQSLAVASYPTDLGQFFYEDCIVTVNSVAYDARDFSLAIDNGLKTDRYYLRGDTRKKEQIEETSVDGRAITGSCEGDFESLTIYNLFANGTEFPLSVKWTSPAEIETGFNYELEITLPRCRMDGETPAIGGPDVLAQPFNFVALQPSSGEPITVRVRDSLTAP